MPSLPHFPPAKFTPFFSRCLLLPLALSLSTAALAQKADEISTDRPDFVESPEVVGKGRLQIETGFSWERISTNGVKQRSTTTPTLLRIGVEEDLELRLETDGRTTVRTDSIGSSPSLTQRGYSDLAIGVKWHMLDEQGLLPSMAVLLHADLDSGNAAFRGSGVRPSVRLVQSWSFQDDIDVAVMEGVVLDQTERGRRFNSGIFGITVAKGWTEKFSTFVEFAAPAIARAVHGGSMASVDVGATYLLNKAVQADISLFHGLNDNTPKTTLSLGLSVKF